MKANEFFKKYSCGVDHESDKPIVLTVEQLHNIVDIALSKQCNIDYGHSFMKSFPEGFRIDITPTSVQRQGSANLLVNPKDLPPKKRGGCNPSK